MQYSLLKNIATVYAVGWFGCVSHLCFRSLWILPAIVHAIIRKRGDNCHYSIYLYVSVLETIKGNTQMTIGSGLSTFS
jgi:hypothetical protein